MIDEMYLQRCTHDCQLKHSNPYLIQALQKVFINRKCLANKMEDNINDFQISTLLFMVL